MLTLHSPSELSPRPAKACLAIGMFDGVHLGHQQVIRQAIADARQHRALSVAVTFDRHPASILAPARAPLLIYTLPQKLRVLASLGVEAALVLRFDRAFSEQSGEAFIRQLARDFGQLHSICVGSAFTFGHQRSGSVALLRSMGQELGFSVHGLAAVALDGQTVSSTRIREAIRSGQLDAASQMLGRSYSISGAVLRGDQLGRKLGFPTANLDPTGLQLPPGGVYAALAEIAGKSWPAAVNIGRRPTLNHPVPELRVEAHLLNFSGDVYGQEMELTFVQKLRDEARFSSLDALKEQIAQDAAAAAAIL